MSSKPGQVHVHMKKGLSSLEVIRDVPEDNFFEAELQFGAGRAVRITDSNGIHYSFPARDISQLVWYPA